MDTSQILKIARDRLGNQPTYNPVDFLEMCVVVRDELAAAEQPCAVDLPCTCGAKSQAPGNYFPHQNGCPRYAANH